VWFGLGMMGLIGWSVVVPTLLGAALGIWLDTHHPGPPQRTQALLTGAGAAGGILRGLFFGGLGWTIKRTFASQRPALWFGLSALLRSTIATAGFVIVSAGRWQRLLLGLIGFLLARWFVQRVSANSTGSLLLSDRASPAFPHQPKEEPTMKIQVNSDNHIDGTDALATHVKAVVENTLRHQGNRLTRVEVHLADVNGGKSGIDDKRCTMEARPRSHQPVSVSHSAGSIHQAIDGAANKLRTSLESVLGRLDDQRRHSLIDPTGAV